MGNWLFVCYGNICRSPIAEHLARDLFPAETVIDSAGTDAWATAPAAETTAIMRDLYGKDISAHKPKRLENIPLDAFDHIVALSSSVADHIRFYYPQVREKIILWEIADPYQDGRDAFARCARQIEKHLQEAATQEA